MLPEDIVHNERGQRLSQCSAEPLRPSVAVQGRRVFDVTTREKEVERSARGARNTAGRALSCNEFPLLLAWGQMSKEFAKSPPTADNSEEPSSNMGGWGRVGYPHSKHNETKRTAAAGKSSRKCSQSKRRSK